MYKELRELAQNLETNSANVDGGQASRLLREFIDRIDRATAELGCVRMGNFYLNIEGTASHGEVLNMHRAIWEAMYLLEHGAGPQYEQWFGLNSDFLCAYDSNGNYRTDLAIRADGGVEDYEDVLARLARSNRGSGAEPGSDHDKGRERGS